MASNQNEPQPFQTTRLERSSYWLYFLGENVFYGLVAVNMQTFYADAGITAASVAAILLITKIWDAINDPLFGTLIDRIRFKKGRFLPWIRIALPLLACSSMFFFALPFNADPTFKIAWAAIGYIAWDTSYTICDVPMFVLPTSMTENVKERGSLLAMGRYFAMIGVMSVSMVLPVVQSRLGWLACGIIFSLIAAAAMLPLCFAGKERRIVRPKKEITFKQMARYVVGNRFLLIFYLAMFLGSLLNFMQYVTIFFARYNLGSQDMAGLLNLFSMIPTLAVGALIPFAIKRVDKFNLYSISLLLAGAIGIIRHFVGYDNQLLFYALFILHGIFTGANNILLFMFTPDCLEYGTYHTGERAEGVGASVQTFFSKLVGSVSGPLVMILLALCGFVSGEGATQPGTALDAIWACYALIPSIGSLISLAILQFYKLRDADVQIMAAYNNGELSKADADELLQEKYGPAAELVEMQTSSSVH